MRWPGGKRFAFTIIDDTDKATLQNVCDVYDCLGVNGFRTTKTVWPLAPSPDQPFEGQTLADPGYCNWVTRLERAGFEVAFHGATSHSSQRERIIAALDAFRATFGYDPRMYVAHVGHTESIYWGEARLNGWLRMLYRMIHKAHGRERSFKGHVPGDPHFWGDVCRERVTYVRNFVFRGINTLKNDPVMPYHDPARPFVNYWFSSSDAPDVETFCELLSERNQDRLVEEGGACIVYTHLAFGFAPDGRLAARPRALLKRLAGLPGWFPPGSTLLDYLRTQAGRPAVITSRVLGRMQRQWARNRFLTGTS